MMKRTKTDPATYTLAELLDDPAFITWVTAPNEQSNSYWAGLQDSQSNLRQLIGEARKLILSMRFQQQSMDPIVHAELWEQIAQQTVVKQPGRPVLAIWVRTMVAAIVAFAVFSTVFYFYTNRQIEIITSYGQIRNILLPDGSEIILNANSSITYANNLGDVGAREVWLKGEAFFKVNHLYRNGKITTKDLFLVHAGKVDIEVLGTTFNVNGRRNMVKVALLSGKVSMEVAGSANQALIMKPGELMYYDERKDIILYEHGSIDANIAWKDGLLIFKELSTEELFNKLEDIYGYKAVFSSADIKQKRISGTFTAGNYDNLLKGIEIALGVSIKKQENTHQLIIQ